MTQKGGLPIVVNGQVTGAMGAGGIGTANAEENCLRDALGQLFEPPLLPDPPAQRD